MEIKKVRIKGFFIKDKEQYMNKSTPKQKKNRKNF